MEHHHFQDCYIYNMPFLGDCYIHDMPLYHHSLAELSNRFLKLLSWFSGCSFHYITSIYSGYLISMLPNMLPDMETCVTMLLWHLFFVAFLDISDSGSGFSGYLAALLLAVVLLSMLAAYMCLLRAEMRSEFEESRAVAQRRRGTHPMWRRVVWRTNTGNFHQHNMVILPAQIWSYSSCDWFLLAVSWFISIITRVWVEDISLASWWDQTKFWSIKIPISLLWEAPLR